ncbi:MAG: hypothetical protein JXB48_08615 [Candidatus Latescibacteria bacterium]|nr:hypothetical protein [Candidatus Latescibacterota bacterium]
MGIKNAILWHNDLFEIYCTGAYDEESLPTVPVSYSDIKGGKCAVFSEMIGLGIHNTPFNPVVWSTGNNNIGVNIETSAI